MAASGPRQAPTRRIWVLLIGFVVVQTLTTVIVHETLDLLGPWFAAGAYCLAIAVLVVGWFALGRRWHRGRTSDAGDPDLGAILEHTSDFIVLLRPDGMLAWASPALGRALGKPVRDLIGRNALRLLWTEDRREGRSVFQQCLARPNESVQCRLRFRHVDGTPRWLEGSAQNRSDDPALRGVVIVARDVTDRREEELRLRTLKRAIEQSPTSIIITNAQGAIEYVNPKFSLVTGYSAEEAIGKNPRMLTSGRTAPGTYRQLWESILAGHEWRGELLNRRKDGELYWELASISPVVDDHGKLTHFVAVKEDITQRKRTEEALEASEALFEQVFMDAPVGIAVADTSSRWIKVNRALAAMLGYTPEELIGKSFKDVTHPPDLEASSVRARALLSGAIVPYSLEKRYMHKNGYLVWVHVHVTLVHDPSGTPTCYAATVMDISARKEAQEALEHWARELEESNRALRTEREIRLRAEQELEAHRLPDPGDAAA